MKEEGFLEEEEEVIILAEINEIYINKIIIEKLMDAKQINVISDIFSPYLSLINLSFAVLDRSSNSKV